MVSGFSTIRVITFSTRLAWSTNNTNSRLQLVSNLFLNAGIPILYIINLVFTHRITRAQHPRFGWHKSLSILGRLTIFLIILTLFMLIYAGVHSAYTDNRVVGESLRKVILAGGTFNTIIAIMPLPMLFLGVIIPKRVRTEKFGQGRFRVKVAVLLTSSSLLTLRALWGTISAYKTPVLLSEPIPWYYRKEYFYTVQLLTELIVVYMFIFVRINRIFYTPDGLPRGSYVDLPKSNAQLEIGQSNGPPPYAQHDFPTTTTLRVYSEEELFEEQNALADTLRYSSTSLLLDNHSGKFRLNRSETDDIYSPISYQGSQRRYSASSHYYYDAGASGDNSRAVSIYAPSAYGHEKSRRDSIKSGYNSPRFGNGDNKGEVLELQRFSYAPQAGQAGQSDMTEMPPSLRTGEYRQSAPVFDDHTQQRVAAVAAGGNFQDRVNATMRDAHAKSMSHQNSGTSTPTITGHYSRPHSVTHSPQRSRASSISAPPVPDIQIAAPARVVSQAPRSPALLGSFEDTSNRSPPAR
jgi:hypothetical protein